MRTLFLVVAIVAIACPERVSAAEQWWNLVQRDAEGTSYFAESTGIVKRGDMRSFWTHYFLQKEEKRIKSARVELEVDCSKSTFQEKRFVDYDAKYKPLYVGDNTNFAKPEIAPAGSVGEQFIKFGCLTDDYRQRHFTEIAADVDYRAVGEFYADPRPIAALPNNSTPTTSTPRSPRNADDAVARTAVRSAYLKFEACVLVSARRFAKSKEAAPVVAKAALRNCPELRSKLAASYPADRSARERQKIMDIIERELASKAELEVVRLRSR